MWQLIPAKALIYIPLLITVQETHWTTVPEPWTLAGQIEQESCITLKHSKCWNPEVELKTAREYGFGLGQITVTAKFNKFEELRQEHAELREWQWERRFDPKWQLKAIVLMDRRLWGRVRDAATELDRWGFMLAGYNGGAGSVLKDRRLCANTAGCDPNRWFEHVEHHSLKSRQPVSGYKKSWFEINREYPRLILFTRRAKYRPLWSPDTTTTVQPGTRLCPVYMFWCSY